MFGTLKPSGCALPAPDRAAYRRLYCGTCKGLGDRYGLASRALLSYDVVLFAAVVEGMLEEPSATSSCRCPLNPMAHRPTVDSDSVPMAVASSLQILLVDAWLEDREVEGRGWFGAARPLMKESVVEASSSLEALGIPVSEFDGLAQRQAELEILGATSPEEVAAPTAMLLGTLFAGLVAIDGLAEEVRSIDASARLRAMGAALGTAIYAIDALEDLDGDARSGAYNPCLMVGPDGSAVPSLERVRTVSTLLHEATETLQREAGRFPWQRGDVVLDNVVGSRLPARVAAAVATAEKVAAEGEVEALVAWRALPWPRRMLATLRRYAVQAWVGFRSASSRVWASAERRKQKRKGGGDVGDAGLFCCYGCEACGSCCECGECCCAGVGPADACCCDADCCSACPCDC